MEPNVFDVDRTSAYTGLSKGTIYAYAERKRIPHLKVGSRLLFKREDLDKWLDRHRVEAIGDEATNGSEDKSSD